jgi:hypothetical protein
MQQVCMEETGTFLLQMHLALLRPSNPLALRITGIKVFREIGRFLISFQLLFLILG